jgi:hypothetical protein
VELTDDELIEIAQPILADLEDRRDVKRPLQALHWGDEADKAIYREIQLMVGRIAWEGVHKILGSASNNDE